MAVQLLEERHRCRLCGTSPVPCTALTLQAAWALCVSARQLQVLRVAARFWPWEAELVARPASRLNKRAVRTCAACAIQFICHVVWRPLQGTRHAQTVFSITFVLMILRSGTAMASSRAGPKAASCKLTRRAYNSVTVMRRCADLPCQGRAQRRRAAAPQRAGARRAHAAAVRVARSAARARAAARRDLCRRAPGRVRRRGRGARGARHPRRAGRQLRGPPGPPRTQKLRDRCVLPCMRACVKVHLACVRCAPAFVRRHCLKLHVAGCCLCVSARRYPGCVRQCLAWRSGHTQADVSAVMACNLGGRTPAQPGQHPASILQRRAGAAGPAGGMGLRPPRL